MMNVLEMIQSLAVEIKDLKAAKDSKQKIIDKYEKELGPLKLEVQDISDTLGNLEMAYESLMLTTEPPKTNVNTVHEEETAPYVVKEDVPEQKFTNEGMLIGTTTRKTRKGVLKKDAQGNVVAQYKSLAEAARDNNFDPSSLRNIILKISKDKQIRMRGVYYVYD